MADKESISNKIMIGILISVISGIILFLVKAKLEPIIKENNPDSHSIHQNAKENQFQKLAFKELNKDNPNLENAYNHLFTAYKTTTDLENKKLIKESFFNVEDMLIKKKKLTYFYDLRDSKKYKVQFIGGKYWTVKEINLFKDGEKQDIYLGAFDTKGNINYSCDSICPYSWQIPTPNDYYLLFKELDNKTIDLELDATITRPANSYGFSNSRIVDFFEVGYGEIENRFFIYSDKFDSSVAKCGDVIIFTNKIEDKKTATLRSYAEKNTARCKCVK